MRRDGRKKGKTERKNGKRKDEIWNERLQKEE